jgi:hypothetical protein
MLRSTQLLSLIFGTIPVLSPENICPDISLRSYGITITYIVKEVSVPKMSFGSAPCKQNNNAFWEEF